MKINSSIPDLDDFVPTGNLADPKTEARIIAALMGNFSSAFPQADSTITVDDFYSEQWRVIYKAIKILASNGTPIDTTSVEHALRRMNKLDAAGGEVVLATVGLQYDENIIHHCDLLVALSLRRQTIARLQQYIDKASSETVDMTTLLAEAAKDIAQFAATATPRSLENKMQELATQLFVTEQPEVVPPLVLIDQTPIVKRGDHTLVVGLKKSRKSLFITYIVTEYLKNSRDKGARVIVFDTEQDRSDVWRGRERIRKATGVAVDFANMRGMSPRDRRHFISWVVSKRPLDIIVIDGIRDCMTNFLDVDETTEVITWLEDMTVKHRIAIVNVLHLNKSDGSVRGHIGAELTNKAMATILLTYNEKTLSTDVKCESSRHSPFEPFSFTHGADGSYQSTGTPSAPDARNVTEIPREDKKARLEAAFDGRLLKYAEMLQALQDEFDLSNKKARTWLDTFVREGLIMKNGQKGDPKTYYKYMGGGFQEPVYMEEPSLFDPVLPKNGQNGHDPGFKPTEDLPF